MLVRRRRINYLFKLLKIFFVLLIFSKAVCRVHGRKDAINVGEVAVFGTYILSVELLRSLTQPTLLAIRLEPSAIHADHYTAELAWTGNHIDYIDT